MKIKTIDGKSFVAVDDVKAFIKEYWYDEDLNKELMKKLKEVHNE